MKTWHFEICVCTACNLRFPREQNQSAGSRCPHCLGEVEVVFQKTIRGESMRRDKSSSQQKVGRRAVLLDNIRSAWNVGSIFRSADGIGFEHVYLCGITPTPENEAVKKTSLGAEDSIPWSYHKNSVELVQNLKSDAWKVYALEEDKRAIEIGKQVLLNTESCLLILGNEVIGVDEELLSLCDEVFYIPMQGEKRSLNVAIAFSVAAFALGQNR